jgi:hypothetical protein
MRVRGVWIRFSATRMPIMMKVIAMAVVNGVA